MARCQGCGATISDDSSRCPKCGANQRSWGDAPQKKQGFGISPMMVLIGIIMLAGLAILVAGAVMVMKQPHQ